MCACFAGPDMKRCGLATHYIPSSMLPEVEVALHALGPRARAVGAVDETLQSFEARLHHVSRSLLPCLTTVAGKAMHDCIIGYVSLLNSTPSIRSECIASFWNIWSIQYLGHSSDVCMIRKQMLTIQSCNISGTVS